jgi:hypothetical protein
MRPQRYVIFLQFPNTTGVKLQYQLSDVDSFIISKRQIVPFI